MSFFGQVVDYALGALSFFMSKLTVNVCDICKKELNEKTKRKYGGVCGRCYRALDIKDRKTHVRLAPTKKTKIEVLRRDFDNKLDGSCYTCGSFLQHENVVFGHIIPFARGGDSTPDNLRAICQACNLEMGDENLYNYFKRRYPERYNRRPRDFGAQKPST
jgi:5-methylcytosine-specific restriction endonuclease McrA